jgi:chitin disaccharide deacetylase
MATQRLLVVTADDFGIGPSITRGILELVSEGFVTNTLLLVNSPYAEQAVYNWQRAGKPMEVGWHPCLTLDTPVLPPHRVPSLIDANGRFHSLGTLLRRWAFGQIRDTEVREEFQAQYYRFIELVGRPPLSVATHHHVQVFSPIGAMLLDVIDNQRPAPFVRRVREPWRTLLRVPGARLKRLWLSWLGRGDAHQQRRLFFPGNQWLIGITNPRNVHDPKFMTRWLSRAIGDAVELTCHPGYFDPTLVGRDCTLYDGQQERRVRELQHLRHPSFHAAVRAAGFALVGPAELIRLSLGGAAHAA